MKNAAKLSPAILTFFALLQFGCNTSNDFENMRSLPFLGFKDIEIYEQDGESITDTIYHQIGKFYFTSHNNLPITNETVTGKVYVADFFFTHCPTICPIMTRNLQRLHSRTTDIDELIIISHTIDPERDSLPRLNEYIQLMDIDPRDDWFFVRGSSAYTYEIGKDEYLINADVDREAEGGFLHSEHFVLIDREGHIRGMYEGTDTSQVNQLEQDLRFLISTYNND